jgi:hypothetical protein
MMRYDFRHRSAAKADGSVAIIFAILLIPVISAMGLAVDHVRLINIRTQMQAEADAAALSARHGAWISETLYRVAYQRQVEPAFIKLIFDRQNVDVAVEAVAEFEPVPTGYRVELSELDPDAGDYNRIGIYCYNAATKRRHNLVYLADNTGGSYSMPETFSCGGDRLEMVLYNIIGGKQIPEWMNDPNGLTLFHTDEQIIDPKDQSAKGLVETIQCSTLEECRPVNEGGIIPINAPRVPRQEYRPCEANTFMYYGWEDTPNFDRDFNDIRVILRCPGAEGTKKPVRLVK